MKKATTENVLTLLLLVGVLILWCTGCTVIDFTATKMDGSTAGYRRITVLGKNNMEDVSISRTGNDFLIELGKSGTDTAAGIAVEAFGIGLEAGRREADGQ